MMREVSLRGALAPVLTPLQNPNPEPGLNQSPNQNPIPPHLPKLGPTPDLPHGRSPAPSLAPSLVLAPVPAPSLDFGLFVMSPYTSSPLSSVYIVRTLEHYPCPQFFFYK